MGRDTSLLLLLKAYRKNLTAYRGKVLNHKRNWHTLAKDKIMEENKNSEGFLLLFYRAGQKESVSVIVKDDSVFPSLRLKRESSSRLVLDFLCLNRK